jgi:hypothetical protein
MFYLLVMNSCHLNIVRCLSSIHIISLHFLWLLLLLLYQLWSLFIRASMCLSGWFLMIILYWLLMLKHVHMFPTVFLNSVWNPDDWILQYSSTAQVVIIICMARGMNKEFRVRWRGGGGLVNLVLHFNCGNKINLLKNFN